MNILFVCLGNICRSPMAEYTMRDLLRCAGLADRVQVASAATSSDECGKAVYPPARRELARHGISCDGHVARQLTRQDYGRYDLLIGMDNANLRDMRRICGGDPGGKLHLLLEYAGRPDGQVADPWYTGDFDAAWQDVLSGCEGLLRRLQQEERIRSMEEALCCSCGVVTALQAALAQYEVVLPRLRALQAYYESQLWLQDYDADRAGHLPADLRRGVLSQDAVYDLLRDNDRLLEDMAALMERGKSET